jgi:hypothetical protein
MVLPIVPMPGAAHQRALLAVGLARPGEAGVDRGLVGHVDRAGDPADLGGDRAAALLVEVEQRDLSAPLAGERAGARSPRPEAPPVTTAATVESIFMKRPLSLSPGAGNRPDCWLACGLSRRELTVKPASPRSTSRQSQVPVMLLQQTCNETPDQYDLN